MSQNFSEVVITNNNSIDVTVSIEAPISTSIPSQKVIANSQKTISVNRNDVKSVKISVEADAHVGDPDIIVLDLTKSGIPYNVYIEKIEATTTIGSIHGAASIKF